MRTITKVVLALFAIGIALTVVSVLVPGQQLWLTGLGVGISAFGAVLCVRS
jgi:uncharacterized membrane protein YgaE (UPF0421/DUF939 family)